MNQSSTPSRERMQDLLADRAVFGIDDSEADELHQLLADSPDADDWSLDLTAAAVELGATPVEPMPGSLRSRIESDAIMWMARSRGLSLTDTGVSKAETARQDQALRRFSAAQWTPWALAAACLLITVATLWPEASPATRYQRLVSAPDVTQVPWNDLENAGITGDIVWDSTGQRGVMRLSGLAVNDPTQMQYQLWIFDDKRKSFTEFDAVDGGVFDIDRASGEVHIAIDAKLPVGDPYLFAITTEPPGGVVKHQTRDDYRIILTAEAG